MLSGHLLVILYFCSHRRLFSFSLFFFSFFCFFFLCLRLLLFLLPCFSLLDPILSYAVSSYFVPFMRWMLEQLPASYVYIYLFNNNQNRYKSRFFFFTLDLLLNDKEKISTGLFLRLNASFCFVCAHLV